MELLWDILREMGILKKEKVPVKKGASSPNKPKKKAGVDRIEKRRRAIEDDDPAAVARAIKRMMKK